MYGSSYDSLHLDDLQGGIGREGSTSSGLSKARLTVQGQGGWAVSRSPQPQPAQLVLPCPTEDFLEQSTSDSTPSPCGFDPHTPDPPRLVLVPIQETIR